MEGSITELDIVIRLCLGFVAGGIIGFERSSRRQVAGLRTHILIALGATCLMLLSIWLPGQFSRTADPGRIAAQVVSGMGFLGAGAIIRLGNSIRGLTTAASLWLTAAIGMAIGAGMFVAAITVEVLSLIALMVLHRVEIKIFPEVRNKLLELHYNHCGNPDTEAVREILKNFDIEDQSVSVHQGREKEKNTKVRFHINIPDTVDISKLAKALKSSGGIDHIQIKEKF
ncbi:MAG: MgtC/SapB family protein [Treponema sp.]|jgi:putative Mg2+ transporter-C (MgtC) family protein|nr:MgtC/SapB family protein [Treponema sp.]